MWSATLSLFPTDNHYIELFSIFSMGMLLYLYKDKIPIDWRPMLISMIGIIVSSHYNNTSLLKIFLAYIVIFISFCPWIKLNNWGKYGDFSYGIYIYAFPVQQTIVYLFNGKMSPLQNFTIVFFVILPLAWLSWNMVEKKCLSFKNTDFVNIGRRLKPTPFKNNPTE